MRAMLATPVMRAMLATLATPVMRATLVMPEMLATPETLVMPEMLAMLVKPKPVIPATPVTPVTQALVTLAMQPFAGRPAVVATKRHSLINFYLPTHPSSHYFLLEIFKALRHFQTLNGKGKIEVQTGVPSGAPFFFQFE
jgi:hypothetical protein